MVGYEVKKFLDDKYKEHYEVIPVNKDDLYMAIFCMKSDADEYCDFKNSKLIAVKTSKVDAIIQTTKLFSSDRNAFEIIANMLEELKKG